MQLPLTVPTVLDRFIQQAVLQVLQERWDRTFSEQSYGFRPGRSAECCKLKQCAGDCASLQFARSPMLTISEWAELAVLTVVFFKPSDRTWRSSAYV